MPGYEFYVAEFCGGSIPAQEFRAYANRGKAELNRYERTYTVSGTDEQKKLAVCAMADVLYYFDSIASGSGAYNSVSVGSVSCSMAQVDTSAKAQTKELYKAASLYLEIYRGVRYCG